MKTQAVCFQTTLDAITLRIVHYAHWRRMVMRIMEGYSLSHYFSRCKNVALLFLVGLASCTTTEKVVDEKAQRQMLALLMPGHIEIIEPFTKVKSFDDGLMPDGIELFLKAVNPLGNPGLMIAGNVRVELFEFVKASADHTGQRLEHWNIELTNDKQQKKHWNQLTQMYEFRLGIDPKKIPQSDEYVILVTYVTPLGEYLTDHYVIPYARGGGF